MSEGQGPSSIVVLRLVTDAEPAELERSLEHLGTVLSVKRMSPSHEKRRRRALLSRKSFDLNLLHPANDGDGGSDPDLTTHISYPQWRDQYNAVAFANHNGWVLQVLCTILWREIDVVDHDEVSQRFGEWTERARKWFKYRDQPRAYVYAHEDTPRQGLHTHVLLHVPWKHVPAFQDWCDHSLEGLGGVDAEPGAAPRVSAGSDDDLDHQWFMFQHMMRGTFRAPWYGPSDGENKGRVIPMDGILDYGFEDCGVVRCHKRVGASRSIDHEAQQKAGFVSLFDRGENSPDRLYSDHHLRRGRRDRA